MEVKGRFHEETRSWTCKPDSVRPVAVSSSHLFSVTSTLRMSGQAFSEDTGAAADSRVRISRGLWGSSPSAGCKLSGAGFSYSGAEFARIRLGSSCLMGPRDFCFAPLPLSARGAPDGATAPVARVGWSTWPSGASAPLVQDLLLFVSGS